MHVHSTDALLIHGCIGSIGGMSSLSASFRASKLRCQVVGTLSQLCRCLRHRLFDVLLRLTHVRVSAHQQLVLEKRSCQSPPHRNSHIQAETPLTPWGGLRRLRAFTNSNSGSQPAAARFGPRPPPVAGLILPPRLAFPACFRKRASKANVCKVWAISAQGLCAIGGARHATSALPHLYSRHIWSSRDSSGWPPKCHLPDSSCHQSP